MGSQLSKIIVDKATQIIVRTKIQQLIEDQQRFQLILLIAEEALITNKSIFSRSQNKIRSLGASNSMVDCSVQTVTSSGIQQAIAL
jgi:hypothetical protein